MAMAPLSRRPDFPDHGALYLVPSRIPYFDKWPGPGLSAAPDDPPGASSLQFQAAYPQPVGMAATLSFALTRPAAVRLELFDIHGRLVTTLLKERRNAGTHNIRLDTKTLASGTYFARLRAGGQEAQQRVIVIQ